MAMKEKDKELINKYLDTISVSPKISKKLFAIGFVGLNGVGKTYVAQKIAEKLNLYIASNDKIRRFLNENGINGSSPAQHLVFEIGPACSRFLYENKISHIIDADLMQYHEITKKNAEGYGASLYIVQLVCPEKIILNRLKKRNLEIQKNPHCNFSRAGEKEYFIRKKIYESITLPKVFFTIDTSKDVDEQIENLIKRLTLEKIV